MKKKIETKNDGKEFERFEQFVSEIIKVPKEVKLPILMFDNKKENRQSMRIGRDYVIKVGSRILVTKVAPKKSEVTVFNLRCPKEAREVRRITTQRKINEHILRSKF